MNMNYNRNIFVCTPFFRLTWSRISLAMKSQIQRYIRSWGLTRLPSIYQNHAVKNTEFMVAHIDKVAASVAIDLKIQVDLVTVEDLFDFKQAHFKNKAIADRFDHSAFDKIKCLFKMN